MHDSWRRAAQREQSVHILRQIKFTLESDRQSEMSHSIPHRGKTERVKGCFFHDSEGLFGAC